MSIIEPEGLFQGERIGACSVEAQLYWPWLYTGANSLGRLELSYRTIANRIFGQHKPPPSEDKLWSYFGEYERFFLALIYEAENGAYWCEFVTSERFLPKYKRARDERSPSPPQELVDKHRVGYLRWKSDRHSTAFTSDFRDAVLKRRS